VSAARISRSMGWRTSVARRVTIRWTCMGHGGWRLDGAKEAWCGPAGHSEPRAGSTKRVVLIDGAEATRTEEVSHPR
jgi:hypothetical protein